MISYKHAVADGKMVFYRDAGPANAPAIVLLHGFPTSSHMFRNLIPELAGSYHVVAPDLPGFGFSDSPDRKTFRYTFENLSRVIDTFTQGHRSQSLRNLRFRLRRPGGIPSCAGPS